MKLFKKDILISWKELGLIFLYTIVVPLLFYYTRDDKTLYLPFYINLFPTLFFLSRNCYKEDTKNIREFAKTLGISKYKFYLSKFLFSLILIILINLITSVFYLFFFDKSIFTFVPLSIFTVLAYVSIFLFLFYIYNYSYAQFTLYIFMLLIIGVYGLSKIDGSLVASLMDFYNKLNGIEVIFIGLLFYFLVFSLILLVKGISKNPLTFSKLR